MADQKITQLTADTAPSSTDLLKTVKDPAGTPLDRKATLLDVLKGAALGVLTSDGDLFTRASGVLTRITRASLAADTAFTAVSMAKVYRDTSAQSAANLTEVAVQFNAEVRDDATYHDNSTNNTRLTVPSTGVYEILGQVTWASAAGTQRSLDIRVNGTDYYANDGKAPLSATTTRVQVKSGPLPLNSGDYVEIISFQNSGGSININNGVGNTFAVIRRLGT